MSSFMYKEFLLSGDTSKKLFFEYASKMPVIDYHCHIDAAEIREDKRFENLSELWLGGDHYKWRLMRACGVSEEYITGSATGYEKFLKFAEILPMAAGNPVYHWAHLELQRFFNCNIPLTPKTAEQIWKLTEDKLKNDPYLSAQGIIKRMNVEAIITTDDPADSLINHKKIKSKGFSARVLPGFRPDGAMNIESSGFIDYIAKLGSTAGYKISTFNKLKNILRERIKHFKSCGCRTADHGFYRLAYAPAPEAEINKIYTTALKGGVVTPEQCDKYRYTLLSALAEEYTRLGWVMELHLGVSRNINSSEYGRLGADTGFDCIGTSLDTAQLAKVLDAMNVRGALPKTLIFSINPNDNAAINTLCACFNQNDVKSKVQQGSAWWFNDSYGGISSQLQSFAEYNVLGSFIGMLTDSRSFTSYVRHEYFRRILCDYIGNLVDSGLYPNDIAYLGKIVQDVCYNNAKEYFNI